MDNLQINQNLINGNFALPEVLPHLDNLKTLQFVFKADFGLPILPQEPGIIMIRGPRQYGKSTWLEQQVAETIIAFGQGSALYLNGDEIPNHDTLINERTCIIGHTRLERNHACFFQFYVFLMLTINSKEY